MLNLNTLIFAVTSPVLSCCIVAVSCVALTLAGGGQGEEGSFFAHNVTIFLKLFVPCLLTVTSIATPGGIVKKVKFLSILTTGAITTPPRTLIPTPYTILIINATTPISTQCMVDTECYHQQVENNIFFHITLKVVGTVTFLVG